MDTSQFNSAALTGTRAFLHQARENRCALEDVAMSWVMARIVLRCPGEAGLTRDFNVPAKIRGAWGRKLAEGASQEALAGNACPWPAPCGYDLFFNCQGMMASGLEIPKPYVLSIEAVGGDLLVTLTLFGIAADWAGEASDALVRALRHGLDESGNRQRKLEVSDRLVEHATGLPLPGPLASASLTFQTPVALRSGEALHVRPASLLKSLGHRATGLALWHGMALDMDVGHFSERAEWLGTNADWKVAALPGWARGSQAQGRKIRMSGVLGTLQLEHLSAFEAGLITLGSYTHVGSRAALGMGRYSLEFFGA